MGDTYKKCFLHFFLLWFLVEALILQSLSHRFFEKTLIQDLPSLWVFVKLWFLEVVQVVLRLRESLPFEHGRKGLCSLSYCHSHILSVVVLSNSSVLLSNIPLPSIAYSFTCFSLKVQGETDGEERGKKACLVLAWGPHALLWEAAWMINGGRSHSGGRWHPRLQRNWGIVMRIDVRTWNGKYGALLEWRRETQVTGREEKSLNAVRTLFMALAGPLPDLLSLFMKQSRPSLHEKPQWQHLVVIWPNGLGALLTNEQINLGGLVALLRTHPLPLPSLPCFHLSLSFSYQGYYSFANCFFSFFFYYYFLRSCYVLV